MAHAPKPFNRYVVHPAEAAAAFAAYSFFRFLPLSWASSLGGWLGRQIGPRLKLHRRALNNLTKAFPGKSGDEVAGIARDMWDHLGRTAAEFPHLKTINVYDPDGPVEVIGGENVDALRDDGAPGVFFSGHIGNWEIVSMGATQRGVPLDRIYREANNRLVDWMYRHGRTSIDGALVPKGSKGARELLKWIKQGRHLGMLVDQKMNDGIAVPFFGRDAMTAPALAELALRYDLPIVAARVTRLKGPTFRLTILPPFQFEKTGDRQADVHAAMTRVNKQLEDWITETPAQWLWMHNRWPD